MQMQVSSKSSQPANRLKTLLNGLAALYLLLFFLAAPIEAAALHFAGGDGTIENQWQITTPQQLEMVGEPYNLDRHFILMADIDLDTPPYNSGQGWVPIGKETQRFSGTFDGNGHTVRNLFIDRPGCKYQGLFGYIDGATIKNIHLESLEITAESFSGALAGYISRSVLTDCAISGKITSPAWGICRMDDEDWDGFLCGKIGGVAGVISESEIWRIRSSAIVTGYAETGGMAGIIQDSDLDNCRSTGLVTGDAGIGGIAGRISNTMLSNCGSSSDVTGNSLLGGIAGNVDNSIIEKSYATGTITGTDTPAAESIPFQVDTIRLSEPPIAYSPPLIPYPEGEYGGIAGSVYASTIENCYSSSPVKTDFNRPVYDDFDYNDLYLSHGGGLIGSIKGNSSVINCYSTGPVSTHFDSDAGGLIGGSFGGLVEVIHSFWDVETSGMTHSAFGAGRTTEQMKSRLTYTRADWDFDTVWGVTDGKTYPYLQWQEEKADEPDKPNNSSCFIGTSFHSP